MSNDPQQICTLIDRAATQYGNKTAITYAGNRTTWAQLNAITNHLAHGLQLHEVEANRPIAMLMQPNPFYVAFYFAALKIGVPLNLLAPDISIEALTNALIDIKPQALVCLDQKPDFANALKILDIGAIDGLIICRYVDLLPFPHYLTYPITHWGQIEARAHTGEFLSLDDLLANPGTPTLRPVANIPDSPLLQAALTGDEIYLAKTTL